MKMVHNGIEYGIMAAYAEGLNILHNADVGKPQRQADAETAPLRDPQYYQYDLDIPAVAEVWRRGSVVAVVAARPHRARARRRTTTSPTSRAGCPTPARAAGPCTPPIDEGVPADVLSAALFERFTSRGERRLRRPAALRDAQGVRRPRREARPDDRRDQVAAHAIRPTRSCFFGMSGDLAHKKIFPALYAMVKQGRARRAGDRRRVVDSGRSRSSRTRARDSIDEHGGGVDDEAAFEQLTGLAALRRRRLQRRRRRSRS